MSRMSLALSKAGYPSEVLAADEQLSQRALILYRVLESVPGLIFREKGTLFSAATSRTRIERDVIRRDESFSFLHWVARSTLSLQQIGRLLAMPRTALVLHDEWAFSGGLHYSLPVQGQDLSPLQSILDSHLRKRKRDYFPKKKKAVSPSNWLREKALASDLMGEWEIATIPYPIDTHFFHPGLHRERPPSTVPRILFVGTGRHESLRKGGDLLVPILNWVRQQGHEFELDVLANQLPVAGGSPKFPVTYWGELIDDVALRSVYRSADLLILPSRIDNFPLVLQEAISCGLPVVVNDAGGVGEAVESAEIGIIADAQGHQNLFGKAIVHFLERVPEKANAAILRNHYAEERWGMERIGHSLAQFAGLGR